MVKNWIVYWSTARNFTVVIWIFFCYIFLVTNLAWFSSNGIEVTIVDSVARDFFLTENPLEEANIVVKMAALSLRRALNFFKHSTVPDSMLGLLMGDNIKTGRSTRSIRL